MAAAVQQYDCVCAVAMGTAGKKTSTLELDKGIDSFKTASFVLKLVRASQTVAALQK